MPSDRRPLHNPFVRAESDLYSEEIDLGWAIARPTTLETVEVGDRILPREIEVSRESIGDDPAITLRLRVVNGIPTCTRVEVDMESSRGVLQNDLASINLLEIVTDVFAAFAMVRLKGSMAEQGFVIAEARAGQDDRRATKKLINQTRRRKITPELLQEVATIYTEHFDDRPTEAVRRSFGLSVRMAAQYVRKARDAGYLGQTTRGRKSL